MQALGATGVISVVSNVAPREMTEMVALAGSGDFAAAGTARTDRSPAIEQAMDNVSAHRPTVPVIAIPMPDPTCRLLRTTVAVSDRHTVLSAAVCPARTRPV